MSPSKASASLDLFFDHHSAPTLVRSWWVSVRVHWTPETRPGALVASPCIPSLRPVNERQLREHTAWHVPENLFALVVAVGPVQVGYCKYPGVGVNHSASRSRGAAHHSVPSSCAPFGRDVGRDRRRCSSGTERIARRPLWEPVRGPIRLEFVHHALGKLGYRWANLKRQE